jgi:hypothetical protein
LPFLGGCSSVATPANAAATIRRSAEKADAAGTARFEMEVTVKGVPTLGELKMTGNGEIDSATQRLHMTLNTLGIKTETVQDGSTVYTRSDFLGDKWLKLDAASLVKDARGSADPFGSSMADPGQTLQYLKDVSDKIETVGKEQVRDRETTHYKATVDLRTATEKRLGKVPDSVEQAIEALGTDTIAYDVWVAADGYLARVAFDMGFASDLLPEMKDLKMAVRLDYFDWGKPLAIDIPPAGQVMDAASALGGLLGGKQP